ncbi:MAG: type II toxin-antitoxin system HicB family antitoxin [Capsulimonadaceae bacterium]
MTNEYFVIVTNTGRNWAAYSPDVDGCVATGKTETECLRLFREALDLHFEGLRGDGLPIPQPSAHIHSVQIAA